MTTWEGKSKEKKGVEVYQLGLMDFELNQERCLCYNGDTYEDDDTIPGKELAAGPFHGARK